jgi:uncharacterized lipoprotein YmbA
MTSRSATRWLTLAALAAGLVLAGCAERQPTRFYMLSPMAAAPPEAAASKVPANVAIGVGPVTLPPYLDRPQLVTRVGSNRAVLADFDSWIEPLPGMFASVLADNLALLLATDQVLLLPQRRLTRLDYQVEVDVTRFDADSSGTAVLDARWWVYGRNGEKLLRSGRSRITEPSAAGDQPAAAAALSRALRERSEKTAAAIADQA